MRIDLTPFTTAASYELKMPDDWDVDDRGWFARIKELIAGWFGRSEARTDDGLLTFEAAINNPAYVAECRSRQGIVQEWSFTVPSVNHVWEVSGWGYIKNVIEKDGKVRLEIAMVAKP